MSASHGGQTKEVAVQVTSPEMIHRYNFTTDATDSIAAALRFSVRDPETGGEPAPLTAATPLPAGQEICLTVVYSHTANLARLYSNAVVVASGPIPMSTSGSRSNCRPRFHPRRSASSAAHCHGRSSAREVGDRGSS